MGDKSLEPEWFEALSFGDSTCYVAVMAEYYWSPCRKHPCSREHAAMVLGYREASRLWSEAAELVASGYASDTATYAESNPRPMFRDWLVLWNRERRAESYDE